MPKKKKAAAKKVAPEPAPAAAPVEENTVEEIQPAAGKDAKDLDAVTDGFASGQETKADTKTMNEAMKRTAAISSVNAEAAAASAARERELAKVKVAPDDVAFFMENCMVEKDVADRQLRESGGVLIDAIQAFVNG